MDHIQIICLRIVFFDNTLTHLNCRNGNLWTTSDTPSDLFSITQYDEEYCQQMLSASLKFAKDIHFKYFNELPVPSVASATEKEDSEHAMKTTFC